MPMTKQLFNTAIKDGKYASIDTFKPGEGVKCGCVCPECGEALVSNVTAKKRWQLKKEFTNHFSHFIESSTCSGGTGETELHLFAKKILEENNSLAVPSFRSGNDDLVYHNALSEPAFPVEKFKQKRPDVMLYDDSNHVICAIEIVVTNPVSQEKKGLYKANRLECLSIDLSDFYNKDACWNKVENEILSRISRKKWIWADEKPADIEGELVERDRRKQLRSDPKKIDSFGFILVAVAGYIFRKPILNLIKKLFRG